MTSIRPAATVVVLRDRDGASEVLLLRRNSKTRFAGGAWVFPGGAVDAAERDAGTEQEAARLAALRECHEEADLRLCAESLLPFAHWVTPDISPKRFSTWFFILRAPDDAVVTVDGGEIIDHRWAQPGDLLEEHRQGDLTLMPPTYVTLLQLAAVDGTGAAAAIASLERRGIQYFLPRMVTQGERMCFLYQEDAGYASSDAEAEGPRHRSYLDDAGCHYENSLDAGNKAVGVAEAGSTEDAAADLPQPNRPFWYRLINAHYRFSQKVGYARPLSSQRMVARAMRRQRGQAFADTSFREGLDAYVDALNNEARLNGFGRLATSSMIDLLLVHRLRLEAWRATHPEVAGQVIDRPLIIAGLPRSGTTFLHQLLSRDEQFRAPRRFEIDRPVPPPREDALQCDPRVKQVQRGIDVIHRIVPHFMAIHPMAARFPDECQQITAYQFSGMGLQHVVNVPGYQQWLLDHDFSADLQYHKRFLQHLQSAWQRDHWLLKSPAHVQYLPTLLKVYPDAMIIHTHRKPQEIMGSVASLSWTMQEIFSDDADPVRTGRGQLRYFSEVTRLCLRDREALDPTAAIFDLRYQDCIADPLNSVRRIYGHFGLTLTPATEASMKVFIEDNKQGKRGQHHYDAAVFGVDGLDSNEIFQAYSRRFNL